MTRRPARRSPRLLLPLLLASALAPLGACADRTRTVVVQAETPSGDARPLADLEVIALPYDRDSVRRALEAAAPTPRPSTAELDSLFARLRAPFAVYTQASVRSTELSDSIRALESARREVPPALRDSLAAVVRARDAARPALERARAELIERDSALRAPVRQWDNSTFRGWDSVTSALAKQRRAEPVADSTRENGATTLRLKGEGSWWIVARTLDLEDPNAEWYWNVRATGDTVRLDRRNAQHRNRY